MVSGETVFAVTRNSIATGIAAITAFEPKVKK